MPPATPIPTRALVLCEDFGPRLGAAKAGEAIAAGLTAAGAQTPDILALEGTVGPGVDVRALLDDMDFDPRMRAARALVLAIASLEEGTLAGSLAFEAATRARQGGVPCYALTAKNRLNTFDVRILDLQAVFQAGTPRALKAAGAALAAII